MKKLKKLFLFALLICAMGAVAAPSMEAQAKAKISCRGMVYVGQSIQLKVYGSGGKKVKWSTSNKRVATVNAKGKVKAIRQGKVNITARFGSRKLVARITVKNRMRLNRSSMHLTLNTTGKLSCSGIYGKRKWYSSNKRVATVNSKGVVKAVGSGKATITCKVGKYKKSCKISTSKLSLYSAESIYREDSYKNSLYGYKGSAKWKSSNPSVLKVNSKGVMKGIKPGVATITASVGYAKKTQKVRVLDKFIASEAKKTLQYTTFKPKYGIVDGWDDTVYMRLKHNYRFNMHIGVKMIFRNARGEAVATSQDANYCLEPGKETVLSFSTLGKVYDSYTYTFFLQESVYGKNRSYASYIQVKKGVSSNNRVMFEMKNTSKVTLNTIHYSIIFYDKDGKVLDADYGYADCKSPGSTDVQEQYFPHDANWKYLTPASYEVLVDSVYFY